MIDKKYPENTSTVLIRLQPKKLNNWELLYVTKNETRLLFVSYVRCVKRKFAKHISSLREAMKMYAKLVRGAKMKTLTAK